MYNSPMHPVRLLPIFKERPWGVRDLSAWWPGVPADTPIGEAWFTADENAIAGGGTLGALIASDPRAVLGRESSDGSLPLLVKLLFTSERLSVQVHPDDPYAAVHHGSRGKTEAWQVLEAAPSAELGLGFVRPLSKDEATAAARSGAIEALLDWRPTSTGDTWLVPARTVHALGAGLTILEVQEQSDITYRLYDYGRPRELHLERGFEVADLGRYAIENTHVPGDDGRTQLTACDHFRLDSWRSPGALAFTPGEPFFHLLVVTAGEGAVNGRPTRPGDVWLVPAASGPFALELDGGEAVVAYTSPSPTRAFGRR
jgi:mannose-6-phosphate isomerase